MKPISILLLVIITLWLTGCGSGMDGRMVGELAWDRVELSNEEAEPIAEIKVHEGQQVEAGALLVQLDTSRARAVLASAAARAVQAKRELGRQQQLIKQNLSSPEQLDRAQSAWEQAQAEEEQAQLSLQRLSIRAPSYGRVDALPFEVGERPPAGSVLAVMLVGDAPYARLYAPESQRSLIRVGDSVRVLVDGRADPLEGKVRRISSDPVFTPFYALSEHERSNLSYLVEVALSGAGDLPAGLPVDGELQETEE